MLHLLGQRLSELAVTLQLLAVALAAPATYEISPLNAPESAGGIIPHVAAENATASVILPEIARCESGGRHLDKNGDIIRHKNKNGSTDWGILQINDVHIPAALKMGLDIFKEADNWTYGEYLYKKHGASPWYGYSTTTGKCAWEK